MPPWGENPARDCRGRECSRGFTIVELLIVVAMLMTVSAIGVAAYRDALDKAKVARATADIRVLEKDIAIYHLDNGRPPDALAQLGRGNPRDPWGNSYEYVRFCAPSEGGGGGGGGDDDCESRRGRMRKDRFLVPLNSAYDLYSKGRDGRSRPPLTARDSWDDIIRANDGGYVGLASEF